MNKTTINLISYCLFFTLGIAVMISGISGLRWFGTATILLGTSYSGQLKFKHEPGVLRGWAALLAAIAAATFVWSLLNGQALVRKPNPTLGLLFLYGVWLYAIVAEYRYWRENRNNSKDA